jgi:glutathione S-transferase
LTAALNRPDHDKQRPSAVAELRACFDVVNRQFLGHGKPFINGNEITLSDVNIAWVVDWLLNGAFGLGKQAGFGKEDFPNIYAWFVIPPNPNEGDTDLTT